MLFRSQNLIANLELEFRSTCRKISPLEISNRKYFAIFHLTSQPRRPTSTNFQSGNPFGSAPIVYPELRRPLLHPRKPFATSLNGREAKSVPLAQPHPRNRFAALIQFLPATDRGSRATEILIANARLEFHPTHRKISHLKIYGNNILDKSDGLEYSWFR